jgi:hypothetical protein
VLASGFRLGLQPDGGWVGAEANHLPEDLESVKERVLKTGRFVNLDQYQDLGDVLSKPLLANLENFVKILTHLDLKSRKLKLQRVVRHLVLLCYKRRTPQKGHAGSWLRMWRACLKERTIGRSGDTVLFCIHTLPRKQSISP